MTDALKLTTFLGERDRAGDRFLADALIDLYAEHGVHTSALLRGIEGFGAKHGLHTARLLTLSEDLPVVTVAVDAADRIEQLAPAAQRLCGPRLVTLERAGLVTADDPPPAPTEATKLTVYCGRGERAGGRPAYEAVVDLLRRHGVAGATALLGVDGTVHGARRRARVVARNAEVPVMVISVGDGGRIGAALPELRALLERPVVTLERVRICKRDGRRLAAPLQHDDAAGVWHKLTVITSELAQHEGAPVYSALVRRLRAAGAAGATVLRGFWGYHGDHPPHGDRFWSMRRHVPVVCVVLDRPDAMRDWYAIVDELTDERGLVTSELVPVARTGA
jgi:PII-like signaling protein